MKQTSLSDNLVKVPENIDFPDETALGNAISKAQAAAERQTERLSRLVQCAVSDWLKEQGVNPESPPKHWGE